MEAKLYWLETIIEALTGQDYAFARKFGELIHSLRFRRNSDLPTPQVLMDLTSKVYKAFEKYTQ